MKNVKVKTELDRMLARSLYLHGTDITADGTIVPKQEAVQDFLKTLSSLDNDPKEVAARLVEAWEDGTGKIQRSLNAVRVETVGNYMVTDSTFMAAFFEIVTLALNEEPYVINESKNEIRIGSVGQDGQPEQVHVVKPESKYSVGLALIASDWVKYKMMDIYRGDVSRAVQATFDIAQDLRIKTDRIHYDLLNATLVNGGAFGAFSYEQTRTRPEQRIYVPHSVIRTEHLPLTNDLDIHADTGNQFTIKVPKEILRYSNAWGNVFPGGLLIPTGEIIVPSSDIFSIADDYEPSANTVESDIQRQVNTNGFAQLRYLGRDWKFIPDVTIPKGTCFPRFNLVPGTSFTKPEWDKEFSNRDEIENFEQRMQRKLVGPHIVSQRRIRALRIKYAA